MNNIDFFTTGVYGTTAEEFKEKLISNHIDTFIDIRFRRAVRGSKYTFANSNRLQAILKELDINYIYIPELATPPDIIAIQKKSDKSEGTKQSERQHLDEKFISEYKKRVLDKYDLSDLLDRLERSGAKRALFFCVEANPRACHRSLVTDRLREEYIVKVKHV
ncbi:MAG TPA: DUF488 domain-containing protein [Bacteroidales bacterium]|nr:DUF488 domain-containing protein [Bacteroidales bacterium]